MRNEHNDTPTDKTGKTSPSVAILSEIAHYLMQPIDFFIKERLPKSHRQKERPPARRGGEHALTMIAPLGLIEDNIFMNLVEAKKGRFVDSHTDNGYSFVYILEGGSCSSTTA